METGLGRYYLEARQPDPERYNGGTHGRGLADNECARASR